MNAMTLFRKSFAGTPGQDQSCSPSSIDRKELHEDASPSLAPTCLLDPSSNAWPLPGVRSLISSMPQPSIMSIEPSPSPGSPPELTYSKSSKSSSYHSSSFADSGPNDIAQHFEDISLDDLQHASPHTVYTRRTSDMEKRPRITSASVPSLHKLNTHTAPSILSRDLTNRHNHPLNAGTNDHTTLSLPARRQKKRHPGKPGPFLPALGADRRSRSPSPISPQTFSSSPRSARLSSSSSNRSHVSSDLGFPSRRQSWQPGRKSIKELEDEYHDSDEELPEDAVIWNVPISPRPPHERDMTLSPGRPDSADVSPTGSLSGLGLSMSPSLPYMNKPLPKSPRIASIIRSASMTAIPEDYSLSPQSTSKSWDAAMSDLSDEARMLTQVLEIHAEEKEREQEEEVQKGSPRKRMSAEKRSITLSSIELPPMRKGELMIDPLPISKEKEKFLTRTRPSWLPPKDPEEEKRHLREYQKMMAKALEAEKKKAKKQHQQQCLRDNTKESLAKVWEHHVLSNWDVAIKEPRTRELWWKGITPRDRGTVWQKAIGNELGLAEASYKAALQRAKDMQKRIAKLGEEESLKEREFHWFKAIRRDISEAFPELKIFQPGGPLHETLLDVLMAYAMYRSDVGYVYGTHFIAGLLILNLSAASSFITLANILNRPLPMSFLLNDKPAINRTYDLVLQTLEYKIPALHTHLTLPSVDLHPSDYLSPMFHSLFCSQKFGMDIASRMLDVYVFEGDKTLIRAAVGTMAKLEGRLYGNKQEILDVLGSSATGQWDLGKEDDFVQLVRDMGKADEEKKGI